MFKTLRFAVLIAGVTFGFTVLAQPAPDNQAPPPGQGGDQGDQADPPTRVARLSYLKGAVSFVPAGENDWVEAQMNRPLITGDKLWTDTDARAELEIGSAAVRMDQQSSFDFLNLDDNAAQMELTQGTMNLRVRRLYDGQTYEIDTPTLAFVVNRVGEFRVDVQPDGKTTIVSVMHGGGDVYGENGARFHIDENQSVSFNDPSLQNYQSADLPPPMRSTNSRCSAMAVGTMRRRSVTSPKKLSAIKIWMSTVHGRATCRNTATCGIRRKSLSTGRRITAVIGPGSVLMAGAGSMTHRGDSRRSITVAGPMSAIVGAGARANSPCVQSMRPRSSLSSAAA